MLPHIFFILLVKHFICDFALQGRFKGPKDKYKLTSVNGHLHALDHALGTAFVFLCLITAYYFYAGVAVFSSIILFGLLDYVLHFFIDWLKNNFVKANGYTSTMREFWILTSVDQSLHAGCYLIYTILFSNIYGPF